MKGALAAVHGNASAREMLHRLVERESLPHALCLGGPSGVGKRTVALALAHCLNCLEQAELDCSCGACHKIRQAIHPDVRTVVADGNFIKIDQIRKLLQLVRMRPYEGRAKVFVIDDADRMNEESANALLKTLEEPPPDTYLVLTTSRPDSLLPTIRSRCRMVRFQALPRGEVTKILERLEIDPDEAARRALYARGSVGTALAVDLESAEARRDRALKLLQSLPDRPPTADLWQRAKELASDKEELAESLETLKVLCRDLAVVSRSGDPETFANPDLRDSLQKLAARMPSRAPLQLFREIETLREAIAGFAARQMAVEVTLLRARGLATGTPTR